MEKDRCDKECFANIGGRCMALQEAYEDECPFRRNDITMGQQNYDISMYDSRASIWSKNSGN